MSEPIAGGEEQTVPAETETEAMDKLLRFCFLKALKTSARKVQQLN